MRVSKRYAPIEYPSKVKKHSGELKNVGNVKQKSSRMKAFFVVFLFYEHVVAAYNNIAKTNLAMLPYV